MTSKAVFIACLCTFAVQTITAQCIGSYNAANALLPAWEAAAPWPAGPLAYAGAPYAGPVAGAALAMETLVPFAPSSGGGFTVSSVSPIAPTGVRVTSENAYEGPLAVSGSLPFLGAVALEGALPTLGSGAINYGCGNGNVAMLNEEYGYNGVGPMGVAGPAYGYNGFAGPLGCGAYY